MAEVEKVATPPGTTAPPETQPPIDPNATPPGTTAPDYQPGTTEPQVRAEKEALFQTRFQELTESQKVLVSKLDQYEQQFGPLPETGEQPPPPEPSGDVAPEFDLYDPESFRKYMDYNVRRMEARLESAATGAVTKAVVKARQDEILNTQTREAFGGFKKWCGDNEIPKELIGEAAEAYYDRWGDQGKPSAAVEWMSEYIVKRSELDKSNQSAVDAARMAAEKGKDLDTVQVPAQGAPPSPEPQPGKTPQQEEN